MKRLISLFISFTLICTMFVFSVEAKSKIPSDYRRVEADGITYAMESGYDAVAIIQSVDKSVLADGILNIHESISLEGETKKINTIKIYGDLDYIQACNKIVLPDTVREIEIRNFTEQDPDMTIVCGTALYSITGYNYDSEIDTIRNPLQNIDFVIPDENAHLFVEGDFIFKKSGRLESKTTHAYLGEKTCNIPDDVTDIGEETFKYCKYLKEVSCGQGVTRIDDLAFAYCEGLEKIDFANVKSIGEWAFLDCKNLRNIYIPKSVTSIGANAFNSCISLRDIKFQKRDSIIKIGSTCFLRCDSVTSLTVPAYYNPKDEGVFSLMDGLKYVKFAKNFSSPYISGMFAGCESLESVTIPQSVRVIGPHTFQDTALEKVEIPKAVTKIREEAFAGCEDLESVTIKSKKLNYIGKRAFKECEELRELTIPRCDKVYDQAFYDCEDLEKVTFTGQVKQLKYAAFTRCEDLEEVVFKGKYLSKFEDYVFYNNKSLKKITISNTKNAPTFTKKTFRKAAKGIKFYVKNKTVAKKLLSNLKKVGYKSAKIYVGGKKYN